MCEKCIHYDVCKYKDAFVKFTVKVPAAIEAVVKVEVNCVKHKDERYFKVVRSMGTEV